VRSLLTLYEARNLKPGDILIDQRGKRWKVTGQVKTWKLPKNQHRIRVPLKHGLYTYDALTESSFYQLAGNYICDLVSKGE